MSHPTKPRPLLIKALVSDVKLSDGSVTLLLPHPGVGTASTASAASKHYARTISEALTGTSPAAEEKKRFLDGWHVRFQLQRHGLKVERPWRGLKRPRATLA